MTIFFSFLTVIFTILLGVITLKEFDFGQRTVKILFLLFAILLIVSTVMNSIFSEKKQNDSENQLNLQRDSSEAKIRRGIDSGIAVNGFSLSKNLEKSNIILGQTDSIQNISVAINDSIYRNSIQTAEILNKNRSMYYNMLHDQKQKTIFSGRKLHNTYKIIFANYNYIEYKMQGLPDSLERVVSVILTEKILTLLNSEYDNPVLIRNSYIQGVWSYYQQELFELNYLLNSYGSYDAKLHEKFRAASHYFVVAIDGYLIDNKNSFEYNSNWKSHLAKPN